MKNVRGIRGAIRVGGNTKEAIFAGSRELILAIITENELQAEDIASIFLTVTPDLNADFPAYAVRELGWTMVPLLCAQEIAVPGAMDRLVRILVHVNTSKSQGEIRHQYLGETSRLRPDLASDGQPVNTQKA